MAPGALHWLSPGQLEAVTSMLREMEETQHDMEPMQWVISDCLLRARRANARTREPPV